MQEKAVLGEIFSLSLMDGKADEDGLARRLREGVQDIAAELARLRSKGLVEGDAADLKLTEAGRSKIRVVFMGGGFEIIHPGHLHTILEAKGLGDVLVVVAARDSTIRKRKGREPISSEEERLKVLSALRPVDAAILGVQGDIYVTLEKVRPDVVALGYDQYHAEEEISKEAERRGMKLKVTRLSRAATEVKTSKILAGLD